MNFIKYRKVSVFILRITDTKQEQRINTTFISINNSKEEERKRRKQIPGNFTFAYVVVLLRNK